MCSGITHGGVLNVRTDNVQRQHQFTFTQSKLVSIFTGYMCNKLCADQHGNVYRIARIAKTRCHDTILPRRADTQLALIYQQNRAMAALHIISASAVYSMAG